MSPLSPAQPAPVLSAHGVAVEHVTRQPVLRGVDLDIPAASRLAILGANGCGKTTLLRVLSGALRPQSGEIRYAGEPLRHDRAGLRLHRQRIQLVAQDPDDQLFSADVRQDVSFGPMNLGLPPAEVAPRVDEALGRLGIPHLAHRATHQLSHGERKRVAIAGAMAMRPGVLLLDEPTAGLDPQGIVELMSTLEQVHASGASVVVTTHDVDLALSWATEVAVLVDGRVTSGAPAALLADGDLLARARLARPWPLELAHRLGWDHPVRSLEDVVAVLRRPTG